jgi:hypothetical protein
MLNVTDFLTDDSLFTLVAPREEEMLFSPLQVLLSTILNTAFSRRHL